MKNQGFTLIELIVVIAVLSILFAVTLVALNPQRQFSTTRDTQRQSDINAILSAMNQYLGRPGVSMPSSITTSNRLIRSDDSNPGTNEVDICSLLVTIYIAAMPYDPNASGAHYTNCSDYNTGYSIRRSASDNRLTVSATTELQQPDGSFTVSVTR